MIMANNIKEEERKDHFKELLGGSEEEETGCRRENVKRIEETENIEEKEIKEVMRKMKNKKAAGIDGIPMEINIIPIKKMREKTSGRAWWDY